LTISFCSQLQKSYATADAALLQLGDIVAVATNSFVTASVATA